MNKIPSFGGYKSSRGETSNKMFQYLMAGSFGALTAAGAKSTVQGILKRTAREAAIVLPLHPLRPHADCFCIDFLVNMSASADVLAQAKAEIDLGEIPEGKNVCFLCVWGPLDSQL